jgi:hypothetical protein
MKHCSYCNTDYKKSETKCPSCSASDYEVRCDACNTLHNVAFCPNCGLGANEAQSKPNLSEALGGIVTGVKCKFGSHDWFGCKCKRCGQTRDENHSFEFVDGRCEQKCSICGKIKQLPHKWSGNTCARCGASKGVTAVLWSSIPMKIRILGGAGILIFIIFIGVISSAINSTPNSDGEIRIPRSPSSFKGQNYHNVADELQRAGFTNVKTEALGDLVTGWLNSEDSVKDVSVAGNTDYKTSTRYPTNVEIIIYYHSFPETNSEQTDENMTEEEQEQQETIDSNPTPEPQKQINPIKEIKEYEDEEDSYISYDVIINDELDWDNLSFREKANLAQRFIILCRELAKEKGYNNNSDIGIMGYKEDGNMAFGNVPHHITEDLLVRDIVRIFDKEMAPSGVFGYKDSEWDYSIKEHELEIPN